MRSWIWVPALVVLVLLNGSSQPLAAQNSDFDATRREGTLATRATPEWIAATGDPQASAFGSPSLADQNFARNMPLVRFSPNGTHPLLLAGAGALGGALGFVGGFALTATLFPEGDIGGGIIGGFAGESLLIPLSVHLANRAQGNLGKAMLVSGGLGVLGFVLLVGLSRSEVPEGIALPIVFAVPVAQVVTSILIERRTSQ
jgi:hypothetical protein